MTNMIQPGAPSQCSGESDQSKVISYKDARARLEMGHELRVAHDTFCHYFGDKYDLQMLDVILATAAVERLEGDPVWHMTLGPPGAAKTETLQSLLGCSIAGAPVIVAGNITSPGALLPLTKSQDGGKGKGEIKGKATGGLLAKLGGRGILIIKDFTSILSMSRDRRNEVVAGLREIYDGSWSRDGGNEGGQSSHWRGRLIVQAASTPGSWDQAWSVVAEMGDRFIYTRSAPAECDRLAIAQQAYQNLGDEVAMRNALRQATSDVVARVAPEASYEIGGDALEVIGQVANFVTCARTPVQRHAYTREVTSDPSPEVPTRFMKQLCQLYRGGLAIGLCAEDAMALVRRCGRDSIPPMRMAVLQRLDDINDQIGSTSVLSMNEHVGRRSWGTVNKACEDLWMLRILDRNIHGRYKIAVAAGRGWLCLKENV